MKVTQDVEHLLRQGRKPKELVELGFPKQVVTKVRRHLKDEKTTSQPITQQGKGKAESHSQSTATLPTETAPVKPKLWSLESKVQQLEKRVEVLEALLENLETRVDGTPVLGLKTVLGVTAMRQVLWRCILSAPSVGAKAIGYGGQRKPDFISWLDCQGPAVPVQTRYR